jgi:hypothetical protein
VTRQHRLAGIDAFAEAPPHHGAARTSMATTFRLEHDFSDIPIELFEKHLNHPELIAMLKDMPGFKSRDLVDKKEVGGGVIEWRFKVVAGGDVPASAKKVISDDMLTWHEETRFVPAEHTIHWKIVLLKEKMRSVVNAGGTWKLVPSGAGTKRIIDGTIDVKIPLVGKVAEAFFANEIKRSYEVEPDIQRKFYRAMKEREAAS